MRIESILNVECSKAHDKQGTPIDCNLLEELQNNQYLKQQDELREETNPVAQEVLKQKMPVLLPSGKFKDSKGTTGLIKHSGFIAIDIDFKDNQHISNFADLKNEICKLQEVAYCGLSVRGRGYWVLIPILFPDKHELHFKFIEQYFAYKRIRIDPSCKNVGRLRFYSYDPDAYYNHSAKQLQAYFHPPVITPRQVSNKIYYGHDKPIWEQYNESLDFIYVLENHGWKVESQIGNKTYFTRPGKQTGVSAEYDSSKKVLYVFTSNGEPFEPNKGYSPFMVYANLENGGDGRRAAKALIQNYKKISGK